MCIQNWSETQYFKATLAVSTPHGRNVNTALRSCWPHDEFDPSVTTLDQEKDPLAGVHYTDLKPLVNSFIQQLVQTKWDVAVHDRDFYLVKPTSGQPKKFQRLTRAEEFVITRLRIGHTEATKSHILSRGPLTACHHCGQTLSIDHMQYIGNTTQLTHWIPSSRQFLRHA